MAARHYRKPHSYKRKKPILRQRFFWLGILIALMLFSAFYFLLFSKTFQITKIIVTGEEKVVKGDIESLAEQKLESSILFLKTKSIFTVDLGQIKEDILNQYPQIAQAQVSRGFLDAVKIEITERQALAVWCSVNCFLLDGEGIIFEQIPETEADLFIIRTESSSGKLGDKVIEKALLSQVFEIKTQTEGNAGIPVQEAFLVSEERLNLKTTEGWQIYFNLRGDLNWQITELKLVLEKQISLQKRGKLEYIDLRFSRVYYK